MFSLERLPDVIMNVPGESPMHVYVLFKDDAEIARLVCTEINRTHVERVASLLALNAITSKSTLTLRRDSEDAQ